MGGKEEECWGYFVNLTLCTTAALAKQQSLTRVLVIAMVLMVLLMAVIVAIVLMVSWGGD